MFSCCFLGRVILQFKFSFFILLLSFIIISSAVQALEVQDVRFGAHQDKTRLVLDIDERVDFKAFILSDPYRVVIDLPDFAWTVPRIGPSQSVGVSAVRHGTLKPGISRIVFDLDRPVRIQKAFVLPRNAEQSARLVLDFSSISSQAFSRNKGKIYGTLDTGSVRSVVSRPVSKPVLKPAFKPLSKPVAKPPSKPLIVIDPGHGGVDPGAIGGGGLREKNIVLALSKALKKELERSGHYRVKMTRTKDRFIKLRDRVKFSRKAGADLFISIHADSVDSARVHGASVYSLSEKASDKQTAKLAARENKADLIAGLDLSSEDKDVVDILVDLARRDTMNQSNFFAGRVVKMLPAHGVEMLERPHRSAGFAVLKAPDIPSILVEAGFVSNKKEARNLNTASYRQKIARGLRSGIDAYFKQVQKNQRE